jgi:hypothetical protein
MNGMMNRPHSLAGTKQGIRGREWRRLRRSWWINFPEMTSTPRWFVLLAALWMALAGWALPARAQDDVPSGGGESDLLSAIQNAELDGSYYVTFDGSATITLTAPIEIPASVPYFTIDGNGFNPTISGGSASNVFIFQIDSGVQFAAIDLTLADGENTNGGAIYVQEDAMLYMTNCVLEGNNAIGTNANPGNLGSSSLQSNGQNGQRGTAGSSGLGGAIFNLGSIVLLNCALSNNAARGGYGGAGGAGGDGGGELAQGGAGGSGGAGAEALGGAICNFGSPPQDGSSAYSVVLSNCTVAGNSAVGGNGGAGGAGGTGFTAGLAGGGGGGGAASGAGLYSTSAVCVVNCTFLNNTAQGGTSAAGAASPTKGKSGPNGPNSFGGGLCLIGQDGMESDITNCTFFANVVIGGTGGAGGAGGVNGGHGGTGGTGTGGSIYFLSVKVPVDDASEAALTAGRKSKAPKVSYTNAGLVVVNSTFSMGSASGGTNGAAGTGPVTGVVGARGHGRGGNVASGAGYFTLMSSIIGTNLSGSCGAGKFIDAGYNLVQDESISVGKKSRRKVNPELATLANNGGPTPTLKLLIPSPATNKIPAELLPATDQRGVPRPASGALGDIGAFELVTKPIILTPPLNVATTNGSITNFTVLALGDESNTREPLYYRWRLNGTNIIGANQSNYFAAPTATFTNQGGYDVVVSNVSGTVTSTPPAYYLFSPFILTQPLTNQGVLPGKTATLTATAIGTVVPSYPNLGYLWQLNGTNLTTNVLSVSPSQVTTLASNVHNFTVQLSYTVFGNVTNGGNYTVAITNNYGGITSSICVVPVGVLITSAPPSIVYLSLGSTTNLTIGASGTAPLTYTWYFNGTALTGSGQQGSSSISVGPMTSSSYGTNSVTVQNTVNSVSYSITLLPTNTVPIIYPQPVSQALVLGSNATFFVSASGGTLSYQWQFNGTNIAGATSTSLTITNEQSTNAGAYAVEVTDSLGSTESSNAFLEVPPSIITAPTNQAVALGSNATFSVTAGGGGLSFQWSFNSNAVINGVITNSFTNLVTSSVLTLTNVQTTNLGTYSVLITNLAGAVTTNASLSQATSEVQVAVRAAEFSSPAEASAAAVLPPLAQPAPITSVTVASNFITFVYPGQAGLTYVLEYKSNLDDPDWVPLLTNTPATDGPAIYQDATTNGSSRYYRIWTW